MTVFQKSSSIVILNLFQDLSEIQTEKRQLTIDQLSILFRLPTSRFFPLKIQSI